uniref:Uncharacterized protein n=1 Tax=Hyaloperonospora arabidopsidis (strain Emoy2) TaxID=559515 RepID=M4C393_HYAAE
MMRLQLGMATCGSYYGFECTSSAGTRLCSVNKRGPAVLRQSLRNDFGILSSTRRADRSLQNVRPLAQSSPP